MSRALTEEASHVGLSGQISFINDWSGKLSQNDSAPKSINRYSFTFGIGLDAQKAFGWSGTTAFASLKYHDRSSGVGFVADEQGFSNIDDIPRNHLYELWAQKTLRDKRFRLKLGKIDANSEFAVVHIASDFLNSSMGYSPTILALPTYPEPQPGLNAFARIKDRYDIGLGLFRTTMGAMAIAEGGPQWSLASRLPGRTALGFWRLGGSVPCFDGDHNAGSQGIYLLLEQQVWAQASLDGNPRKLSTFFQYGTADENVSAFEHHVGGGLVLEGPLSMRPKDSAGLAATFVRLSDEPEAAFTYRNETAIELYYKIVVTKFIALVPDLQYIEHHGGVGPFPNTFVLRHA